MNKRIIPTITNDKSKEMISANNYEIQRDRSWNSTMDWTALPGDTIIQIFSVLNYQDRANLSSACPSLRSLAASPCLWRSLDLQAHTFDISSATSLASRCSSLQKLCFRGEESAEAIISLRVRNLIEIRGNFYGKVNDATLSTIVDMNKLLEIIEFGSSYCKGISSAGIKSIAKCCLNLKKLWLSGVKHVNSKAINALSNNCHSLVEIAFTNCRKVDEIALTKLVSVQFLSIAGTKELDSDLVMEHWIKFENLLALDVSRTDISTSAMHRLLSYSPTLKVICALNCEELETDLYFSPSNEMGIEFISLPTYTPTLLDSQDITIMPWIEQVLSRSLLNSVKSNPRPMKLFWLKECATLMTHFLKSSEEDVQKRAIRVITILATTDLEEGQVEDIYDERVKAIFEGGVTNILNLVKSSSSSSEGVKLEVAKAINIMFSSQEFKFVLVREGVIEVLMKFLESMNRSILEKTSNALRHLPIRVLENEYENIISECGGLKILKNLVQRWTSLSENVLNNVVATIANLTSDEQICVEITRNGCLEALMAIAQECVFVRVLEQVTCVFVNMTGIGHANDNNMIGQHKLCAIQKLVQFIRSPDKHTCQQTVEALNNLSFDERNREEILAMDVIEALVYLAKETTNYSWEKWKRTSGVENFEESSESNKGQNRGCGSKVFVADDIHVTITGVIWNLLFKPDIALRVVEENGIQVLVRICLVSGSELARFMAILVMAYIFHVLPEGWKHTISDSSNEPTKTLMIGMKHIEDFIHNFLDDETLKCDYLSLTSINMNRIVEFARIKDVHQLKLRAAEIERFVNMLRSPSFPIKSCAAFALMQFTKSGYKNTIHHIHLLQNKETIKILRSTSKCSDSPFAAKIFSKIVLHNLNYAL